MLFPIELIKDNQRTKTSRIREAEGRQVSSGQCAASCVFDNTTKVVGARLECFSPFILLTRPRAFRLPPILMKKFKLEIKIYLYFFFAEKPKKFWNDGVVMTHTEKF